MEVELIFELNEEVTPELFAVKVALALAKENTISVGERVWVRSTDPELMNCFTFDGYYMTDLGGILSEEVVRPNVRSERV